jgi:hypothetical protein
VRPSQVGIAAPANVGLPHWQQDSSLAASSMQSSRRGGTR